MEQQSQTDAAEGARWPQTEKYFPTPPKTRGYRPRELSGIEQALETAWNNAGRVDDILTRHVTSKAPEEDRARILREARAIIRLCEERKYSPFAAVDELGEFLGKKNLLS